MPDFPVSLPFEHGWPGKGFICQIRLCFSTCSKYNDFDNIHLDIHSVTDDHVVYF